MKAFRRLFGGETPEEKAAREQQEKEEKEKKEREEKEKEEKKKAEQTATAPAPAAASSSPPESTATAPAPAVAPSTDAAAAVPAAAAAAAPPVPAPSPEAQPAATVQQQSAAAPTETAVATPAVPAATPAPAAADSATQPPAGAAPQPAQLAPATDTPAAAVAPVPADATLTPAQQPAAAETVQPASLPADVAAAATAAVPPAAQPAVPAQPPSQLQPLQQPTAFIPSEGTPASQGVVPLQPPAQAQQPAAQPAQPARTLQEELDMEEIEEEEGERQSQPTQLPPAPTEVQPLAPLESTSPDLPAAAAPAAVPSALPPLAPSSSSPAPVRPAIPPVPINLASSFSSPGGGDVTTISSQQLTPRRSTTPRGIDARGRNTPRGENRSIGYNGVASESPRPNLVASTTSLRSTDEPDAQIQDLTADEVAELRQMFAKYDVNGDHYLALSEVSSFLHELEFTYSEHFVQTLIDHVCGLHIHNRTSQVLHSPSTAPPRKGLLTFDEFLEFMRVFYWLHDAVCEEISRQFLSAFHKEVDDECIAILCKLVRFNEYAELDFNEMNQRLVEAVNQEAERAEEERRRREWERQQGHDPSPREERDVLSPLRRQHYEQQQREEEERRMEDERRRQEREEQEEEERRELERQREEQQQRQQQQQPPSSHPQQQSYPPQHSRMDSEGETDPFAYHDTPSQTGPSYRQQMQQQQQQQQQQPQQPQQPPQQPQYQQPQYQQPQQQPYQPPPQQPTYQRQPSYQQQQPTYQQQPQQYPTQPYNQYPPQQQPLHPPPQPQPVQPPQQPRSIPAYSNTASLLAHSFDSSDDEYLRRSWSLLLRYFDRSGTGSISVSDIAQAFRSMGLDPSQRELEEFFEKADLDGSGRLNFDEFATYYASLFRGFLRRGLDLSTLKHLFTSFDDDGDGTVSLAEFRYAVRSLCPDRVELPDQDVERLVLLADPDGDGVVTWREFVDLIRISTGEQDQGAGANRGQGVESDVARHERAMALQAARALTRKIVRAQMPSPLEHILAYAHMPSTFRPSMLAKYQHREEFFPSSMLNPVLHPSGMYYEQFQMDPLTHALRPTPLHPTTGALNPNHRSYHLELEHASGIPLPPDVAHRSDIVARRVRVCLLEGTKPLSNLFMIKAEWDPLEEDRWRFNLKFGENDFNSFAFKSTAHQVTILFELTCLVKKQQVGGVQKTALGQHMPPAPPSDPTHPTFSDYVEMSCGFATLSLDQSSLPLTKEQRLMLPLQGGNLDAAVAIKDSEVLARRSGWRAVTQLFSGPVRSVLNIKLSPALIKEERLVNYLRFLPCHLIVAWSQVEVIKLFLELLASFLLLPHKQPLQVGKSAQVAISLFLRHIVDQPDFMQVLAELWADTRKGLKRVALRQHDTGAISHTFVELGVEMDGNDATPASLLYKYRKCILRLYPCASMAPGMLPELIFGISDLKRLSLLRVLVHTSDPLQVLTADGMLRNSGSSGVGGKSTGMTRAPMTLARAASVGHVKADVLAAQVQQSAMGMSRPMSIGASPSSAGGYGLGASSSLRQEDSNDPYAGSVEFRHIYAPFHTDEIAFDPAQHSEAHHFERRSEIEFELEPSPAPTPRR